MTRERGRGGSEAIVNFLANQKKLYCTSSPHHQHLHKSKENVLVPPSHPQHTHTHTTTLKINDSSLTFIDSVIADRPKAALLFCFFVILDVNCVPLFIVILVIYKYKNRYM